MKPRLVGICGAPLAGKSSVAALLARRYGAEVVDDGAILREACCALYGGVLSDWQTQEGKREIIQIGGSEHAPALYGERRGLLGLLGNDLERRHGEHFMPYQAVRKLNFNRRVPFFVFPSVRKTQGWFYREHVMGGIVVEVRRPRHEPVNDFDRYDIAAVTHVINNTGDESFLERQVAVMFDQIMGGE